MPQITGKTAVVLMLANPVSHIRGTLLINDSLAALGLDACIMPLQVAPADLPGVVASLRRIGNLAGLGITIPHKIAIVPLLDALTDEARRVGAVNFVRREPDGRLTGTNIDGAGFIAGLQAHGVAVAGRKVLMSGAGGVARPIAFSLADAGVARLLIINRDQERAEALARDVRAAVPGCDCQATTAAGAGRESDLVINATSLGMGAGDALPLPPELIPVNGVAAEVVVSPPVTSFLALARAQGCQVIPGDAMLKPQPGLFARFCGLIPG